MYDFLVKKGTTVAFIIGIIVIAVFLFSAISGLSAAGYDTSTDLVAQGKEAVANMHFFDLGIWLTNALIVLAIGLMVVFFIVGIIKFPKEGLRTIITFAGLIVLFFILKGLAPEDMGAKMIQLKEKFKIDDSTSSLISGGIMTTIGLIAFAALSMIVFEIRNAFK